jgi:hypothetical protein
VLTVQVCLPEPPLPPPAEEEEAHNDDTNGGDEQLQSGTEPAEASE